MARVAVDGSDHQFYREITGRGQERVFEYMRDAFVVAFSLGARNGVPVPLNKREEIFETTQFTNEEWAAFEAAYLSSGGDIENLGVDTSERRNNAEIIAFIENYARAGTAILKRNFDPRRAEIDLALLLLEA